MAIRTKTAPLTLAFAAAAITLAGCGSTMEQRAATGALGGAVVAGPIGAAVGAAGGAVVSTVSGEPKK
jgi:osmotically inducible lipoprotein OsmB